MTILTKVSAPVKCRIQYVIRSVDCGGGVCHSTVSQTLSDRWLSLSLSCLWAVLCRLTWWALGFEVNLKCHAFSADGPPHFAASSCCCMHFFPSFIDRVFESGLCHSRLFVFFMMSCPCFMRSKAGHDPWCMTCSTAYCTAALLWVWVICFAGEQSSPESAGWIATPIYRQ